MAYTIYECVATQDDVEIWRGVNIYNTQVVMDFINNAGADVSAGDITLTWREVQVEEVTS